MYRTTEKSWLKVPLGQLPDVITDAAHPLRSRNRTATW